MEQLPTTYDLELQSIERARRRADDGGVWSHSKDRRYVIFCVGQKEHQIRRFLRFALKHNLGFKPLRGSYKGREERSFIINLNDLDRIRPFIHGQESILILHSYDRGDTPRALLYFTTTGETTSLGRFTIATEAGAKQHDSWTFDPITGCYFVTTG